MKILAVDDEPDILAALDLSWDSPEVDLEVAEDAQIALQAIAKDVPRVLITDFRMPGMDGIELINQVRNEHKDVFTILMTAYPDPSLRDQARAVGCDMFLPKPFDPDDVLEQIKELLKGQ